MRSQSLVDVEVTQEEKQATQRLKQAEGKITSLMQELDELRFFSEIEAASPSPAKKDPLNISVLQHKQHSSTELVLREKPTTTLSPRRLSQMDRTSLELEAQQLQRQVDILEREKASLEATVEMQDATATSRHDDVKRMIKLEQTLMTVQQELSTQLDEIQKGRTKLTDAYEEKLKIATEQYRASTETADELMLHLEETQKMLENLEKRHFKSKEDASRKLQEQSNMFQHEQKDWEKRMIEKEEAISKLQEDLVEANMALEVAQSEKEEAFETSLQEMEQQLQQVTTERDTLQSKHDDLQTKLGKNLKDLQRDREKKDEHVKEFQELKSRMEEIETQHAAELEELKTTLEDREKRRLDDLVVLQQDSNKEYERRLKALQEQLSLATDRHQEKMEQSEREWQAKIEKQLEAAKQQIRDEYEPKLREARADVAVIQLKYEEAKQESMLAQVKSESKDRDAAREWERKDAIRQGELDIMHDKLDRTMRELAEKEARIQQLHEKIADSETRRSGALADLETQHAEEIAAREELLANQRQLWKASEAKLRTELARKDNELVTLQETFGATSMQLKKELAEVCKELEVVKKSAEDVEALKEKLSVKQTSCEQLQKDLISEQARHESIEEDLRVQLAKLEGRLSATETSLVEKKLAVEDLEQLLLNASNESSLCGNKYESQIVSLKAELSSLRNSLTIEQSTLAEKESLISKLEGERKESKAKLEQMSTLEKSVSTLQRALSEVQAEKDAQAEEFAKIKEDVKREADTLHARENQFAIDKGEFAKVLERKDEEIKELTVSHMAAISKLKCRLDEDGSSKASLLEEVEKLKKALEEANKVSESRSEDSMHFQQRINELEEQIEMQRKSVARNVSDSQETVTLLREQLSDAEKAQKEVAEKLELLLNEKEDVVDALEQVLNEVQGRDEEIESLTELLEKRDEELEHAKIIATKAIAQAQEFQNKYKVRNSRESASKADLETKIESLNVSLEFLAAKNEDLQKKTSRLESELREKEIESARLKDAFEPRGQNSPGDYGPKENLGFAENEAFSPSPDSENKSSSSSRRSRSSPIKSKRKPRNGFAQLDNAFSPFEEVQESNKLEQLVSAYSAKRESLHASSRSVGDFGQPVGWVADFEGDFDSKSDFHDARSDSGIARSRQSIERDALRKYVRKRYLKHGESR